MGNLMIRNEPLKYDARNPQATLPAFMEAFRSSMSMPPSARSCRRTTVDTDTARMEATSSGDRNWAGQGWRGRQGLVHSAPISAIIAARSSAWSRCAQRSARTIRRSLEFVLFRASHLMRRPEPVSFARIDGLVVDSSRYGIFEHSVAGTPFGGS
jgi:hypothetical protein